MIYLLTALGCIGGLLFGYDTGIISGALVLIDSEFALTQVEESLVVSLCVAGALISSIFAGSMADYFGRKSVVIASSLAFIIGAVLMALSRDFRLLLVGRFIVGLGVGSASLIVPIYLAECAPTEHRGSIVACVNMSVTFGQLLACIVAGLFSGIKDGWRWMLGLAGMPALLQLVGFWLWVPESPRFLIQKGYTDLGSLALRKLRNTIDVRQELHDILISVRKEEDALAREAVSFNILDRSASGLTVAETARNPLSDFKTGYIVGSVDRSPTKAGNDYGAEDISEYEGASRKELKQPSVWKLLQKITTARALLVGSMLQSGQQIGGINTVMYFGATIFTLGGSSHITAIWLTVGLSFCNFIGSCISFYLQDRVGRRLLTLLSMSGVSLSLLIIAAAFFFTVEARSEAGQSGDGCISSSVWLIFFSICVYLVCFASGMGSTPWTVCAEIYPTSVRGVATSITTSVNWTSNFIMSMSFLSIVSVFSEEGAFLLYSLLSLCFVAFFYKYLPETRGVPLENIPRLFYDAKWGKEKNCYTSVPTSEAAESLNAKHDSDYGITINT